MRRATRCVVPPFDGLWDGSVQPIDPSTAFTYMDADHQAYPRYFNTPNQDAVAATIAALESAAAGLVFASGMAAISTTINALLAPGDHAVFLRGLYGGSHAFITSELDDRQIEYSFADKRIDDIAGVLRENTRMIYVESPTNPLLQLVDLKALAALAKANGITTVIDNTFASPINQNPSRLGIDVVVHSGTKYLGGHSDLCCGAVCGQQSTIDKIRSKAKLYGGSLNALTAYLLQRSLKTLAVRVATQTDNAQALAEFLVDRDEVAHVHYPGLRTHPDHEVAQAQMHAYGAMLAFELAEGRNTETFMRGLRIIRPALSLGGVDSSMCVPATTSHRDVPVDELQRSGVTPRLIRFSVGIEDLQDLQEDLEHALTAASRGVTISQSAN